MLVYFLDFVPAIVMIIKRTDFSNNCLMLDNQRGGRYIYLAIAKQ